MSDNDFIIVDSEEKENADSEEKRKQLILEK